MGTSGTWEISNDLGAMRPAQNSKTRPDPVPPIRDWHLKRVIVMLHCVNKSTRVVAGKRPGRLCDIWSHPLESELKATRRVPIYPSDPQAALASSPYTARIGAAQSLSASASGHLGGANSVAIS